MKSMQHESVGIYISHRFGRIAEHGSFGMKIGDSKHIKLAYRHDVVGLGVTRTGRSVPYFSDPKPSSLAFQSRRRSCPLKRGKVASAPRIGRGLIGPVPDLWYRLAVENNHESTFITTGTVVDMLSRTGKRVVRLWDI